jgi:hypothetical protein
MLYIMSRMFYSKVNQNIRLLGQVGVSTVLWAATFVATKSESFEHPGSLAMRIALVVMGIGGFLPVVFVYAKSIRMQDEFNQRIHFIALSIAFAATAVVSYAADLLFQAGFIPQFPSTGLWALMVAIWFITMIVTPRFYR